MKLNKILMAGITIVLVAGNAWADDFDFGDFGGDSSSSAVEVSGAVNASARAYITGDESVEDLPVAGDVDADVNIKYSGNAADAEIKLNLNKDTLLENPQAIVDEASVATYVGNLKLEAGKMKTVWGKGDKLHVIDNFNADDYTDFIIPDYIDRRIATPMVKASYAFDYSGNILSNMKLEAVYTPFLPTDRFATSGVWTPAQVQSLTGAVTVKATSELSTSIENLEQARILAAEVQTLKDSGDTTTLGIKVNEALTSGKITSAEIAGYMSQYSVNQQTATAAVYADYVQRNLKEANAAYTYALNNASALSENPSMIYPDTYTLKYGQAGTRFTYSLGPVDMGLSYYYGHYKQPSVNALKMDSYLNKYINNQQLTEEDKFLAYDQKQTFGIEAATILWHFNVRGEACYNLTEDIDGTDPWVHNNSVQWLGGFDIDLPLWNMNLNVQETGTYVLNNDKISGPYEVYDVDYNANGYSNNKIVANLTSSFENEKILPEVTVMYSIESGDVVVLPKLVVKPAGEVSLSVSGMYIWCNDENSEFAAWDKNNFVQIGASITF